MALDTLPHSNSTAVVWFIYDTAENAPCDCHGTMERPLRPVCYRTRKDALAVLNKDHDFFHVADAWDGGFRYVLRGEIRVRYLVQGFLC